MHSVKLISYTQPAEGLESLCNVQELIAYVARVSSPANQDNLSTSAKLIEYLIKHNHWSPLEMADATLEIETTRDIGRQILRHRSFVFQEFSQRYANPLEDLQMTLRETRMQDTKNRQNSLECTKEAINDSFQKGQYEVMSLAKSVYRSAVANGVAKEQARSVLPEGLTMTRMYMKGSLRSWIHYLAIRKGEETQKEHREIAQSCADVLADIFPMIRAL